MSQPNNKLREIFAPAIQQKCWHVSVGGCTLPTFSLAIGAKIKRDKPLKNQAQPEVFRNYRPEISFLIWCAWRLHHGDSVLVTHKGDEDEIVGNLRLLVGNSLTEIGVAPPAWDLMLNFTEGFKLAIFCDHAGKKPVFDGNWQARVKGVEVNAGPGSHLNTINELDTPTIADPKPLGSDLDL